MWLRWKWTCIPAVIAMLILCLAAPTYLILVQGTNRWGSDILRAKEEVPTRKVPTTAVREEKTGKNNTNLAKSKQSKTLDASPIAVCCMNLMNLDKDKALVMGDRRKNKAFLTIGISYTPLSGGKGDLRKTLLSLIPKTPDELKSQVSIVVFTSALDVGFRQLARDIVSSFPPHARRGGLLQLIEAPRSFYPNQNPYLADRVKRNLDAAFLIAYAAESSKFYLQLSYDLKAPPNYLQSIRDFINHQGASYWVALEFYPVGFTGKLFRGGGRDIQQLIHLLTEYNEDQTTESLFTHFKNLNVQQREIIRIPPLFGFL